MNAKEAREIIEAAKNEPSPVMHETKWAQGYLEALQGEEVKELVEAQEKFIRWFNFLKQDTHEKLVLNQTFESASENWDKLEHQSFDTTQMERALSKYYESIGE